MVRPALRSRSYRRLKVKTPGGVLKARYERRKPQAARCGCCGKPLAGVKRDKPVKMTNAPKSDKKVQRPHGGNLCHGCLKIKIKEEKVYSG